MPSYRRVEGCGGRGPPAWGEGRGGPARWRGCVVGSSASRNPAPNKFVATTASTMAIPGNVAIHGACTNASRPVAIMLPQDGAGGGTPIPRKESPDSNVIAFPTANAAATITGVAELGSRWRQKSRWRDRPIARAAST